MDPLSPLIGALHSEGRLRVWSLVITVFGDLVQHRGGQISTARLGQLLGRVGVEQGAMRTALSRLGRDGWVESERSGRTSLYRLSAQGLERFAPATTRIYAAPETAAVSSWSLAIRLDPAGNPEITLGPASDAPNAPDCQVVGQVQSLSEPYRESLLSEDHRKAISTLARDLNAIPNNPADPLDAAAARLLLIHRWRRIVLRYPERHPALMPKGAVLQDPRAEVARAYAALWPAAEAWLSTGSDTFQAMPDVNAEMPPRFGTATQT